MPRNALVASDWNKFTVLLYFQKTKGVRPDLTLIERSTHRRYYEHGVVHVWQDYASLRVSARPVVMDEVTAELRRRFTVRALGSEWFLLEPRSDSSSALPRSDRQAVYANRSLMAFNPGRGLQAFA